MLARFALGETPPVLLELSVGSTALDEVALRDAIGRELKCPVVTNRSSNHSGEILLKSLSAGQVSVTFVPADQRPALKRVVNLPQTPEHRVQLIAWLVGNMARNEAEDWLANRQRKQAELDKHPPAKAESTDPKAQTFANKPDAPATADFSVGNAANNENAADESGFSGRNVALHYYPINLGVWHQALQLHRDSETSRFGLHLGIGYGRLGAIRGFGFDLIHQRTDGEVQGVAASPIWTRAARTQGVAFSLGVVTAEQDLRGVDYAGLVAYRAGNLTGAQIGGVFAQNNGDSQGAQLSVTVTEQVGTLRGVQLAAVNVADTVTGVQLGAINVAKDMRGVQFGLVNVARHMDGVAIGLVNISDNVRTEALLWSERNYLENIGLRYLYSPLTVGVSAGYDSANDRARLLFGLGVRVTHRRFALAPMLDVGFVRDTVRNTPVSGGHDNDLRCGFEYELVPKVLGFAAGPAVAVRSEPGKQRQVLPRWFAGLTPVLMNKS